MLNFKDRFGSYGFFNLSLHNINNKKNKEMKTFIKEVQKQFAKMVETGRPFRSNISGNEVWDTYLKAFENDPIFRDPESSAHNCNNCKNFMRRYGNIVSINNKGELESIFSNLGSMSEEYVAPAKAVANLLEKSKIANVFFETYDELNSLPYESCNKNFEEFQLGIAKNFKQYTESEVNMYGKVTSDKVYEFNHLNLKLPAKFVDKTGNSIEAIMAHYRDKYSVFKRTMEEIPLDTLNLVKDLINQGSLLDGTTHLHAVEEVIKIKEMFVLSYDNEAADDLKIWQVSYDMSERTAKFKNTLIGVLCTELAEGVELNKACTNWNKRVDPINYHKATAPITQKQIKEAQKFVEENGFEESFDRRLATIEDIKASEILHLNSSDGVKKVSIFDNVKSSGSGRHKRSQFDNVQEISIEKFMKDVLPGCTSIEAFLENRMEGNLVTLTKAASNNSKNIFKWDNNYSYTFNGNLAGKSQIKENVKKAGGKVDGFMRFSIQWNDKDTIGIVDWDAHCITPYTEISYSNMNCRTTRGKLDVDMINPSQVGVENIYWKTRDSIKDGKYIFFNRNFNNNGNNGFKAEIEVNGETYSYQINGNLRGDTKVATITVRNGEFLIEHHLPETNSSKELWSINTQEFHKVNLICLTPNHWGENEFGNKHYLFMLEGCKAQSSIRGFHNEHLIPDLLKHRKVMEVLGATTLIEPTDNQLSGIGFNATVSDELIVKVQGTHKRVLKIKF